VDAFEATLQEAAQADLLLHVVDASHPQYLDQIREVQKVLKEIHASDLPQVMVFNKIDALSQAQTPLLMRDVFDMEGRALERIFLSAHTGQGMDELRALLAQAVIQMSEAGLAPDAGEAWFDESQQS
jgi:GTP-binding protein HflX